MLMRYTLAAAAAVLLTTSTTAASPSAIAGRWKTDDGKAIMEIAPCGPALCAKIAKFLVAEPAGGARDDKNPDKALRSRPLIGVNVLTGLVANGNGWTGKGYSPEEGRHFKANVSVAGNKLTLKGCVAVFCRTVGWTRAK
jgi:uncharacterized protein (DUF2147 family)